MRSKVYSSEVEGRSTVKCPPCKIVDTVQMSIPPVDAGPIDHPYLKVCVVEINDERNMYRLGTRHGLINGWFARNTFGLCKQNLIHLESVNNTIS